MREIEVVVRNMYRLGRDRDRQAVFSFETEKEDVSSIRQNLFMCLSRASRNSLSEVTVEVRVGRHISVPAIDELAFGLHQFIATIKSTSIKKVVFSADDRSMEHLLIERVQHH